MSGDVAVLILFPDFPGLDIPAGFNTELGYRRAGVNLHHFAGDAVTLEGFFNFSGPLVIVRLPDFFFGDIIQNFNRR